MYRMMMVAGLLLASCASTRREGKALATLDSEFELAHGQSATIEGERLSIEFSERVGDSRCPTGVQCVWAGNATVRIRASKPGSSTGTFELNTSPTFATSARYDAYRIELRRLAPYPVNTAPHPPAGAVVTLLVTKP